MLGPIRYILRARRAALTYVWTTLYNLISGSNAPQKHIKIDDEEGQIVDHEKPFPHHPRPRLTSILKMLLLTLLTLLVILLLLAYLIYKPPKPIFTFLQWKYPSVLFQVSLPSSQRVVALTIDDAPSSETAKMLDLLKAHNAKATFFIIGSQVSSHPLLQRIHDEGHETGSHAWRDEPSLSLPLTELKHQMEELEALLPANENGMKYFRPGSGFWSKGMLEMVKGLGYRTVLGCVYPHDPQIHSARVNAQHVLSMVRPGAIIIMHDRRPYSAEQLERILKGLAEGGWRVESLGGLLKIAEDEKAKKGGLRGLV
jgi:peptidoglycan/xylan/chitin deacetylase (PgdA/CDA1 family)